MRLIHVVAAASLLALAGCGVMPVPTLSPSPTGSLSATPTASTPTATATAAAPPDADILFTISATLTSPVGAVARVEQVVYKPTATPDGLAGITAQLDSECEGWRPLFTSPQYLVSVVTATDLSTGGKKWPPSGQVVVSMNGTAVFQGDYTSFQSYCSSVQVLVPGEIRGVTPVSSGSPDSAQGWGTLTYGFGIATEPGTEPTDPRYVQLSNCAIAVSDEAKALSTHAAAWKADTRPGACELNIPGV